MYVLASEALYSQCAPSLFAVVCRATVILSSVGGALMFRIIAYIRLVLVSFYTAFLRVLVDCV